MRRLQGGQRFKVRSLSVRPVLNSSFTVQDGVHGRALRMKQAVRAGVVVKDKAERHPQSPAHRAAMLRCLQRFHS
jgi:hypothetical protein